MGYAWCTSPSSGYVEKLKIKDNPRFITTPFQETKTFEKLYLQRTSVQQMFSDSKNNYNLNSIKLTKMPRQTSLWIYLALP